MKTVLSYALLLIVAFSSPAFSKTLIVSDIDDTIKVSHVRDTVGITVNAYKTTASFQGMNVLYQNLLSENKDAEIIYVTNAYSVIMNGSHKRFLADNNFPKGKIFFRSLGDENHKVRTIRDYIVKNNFDKLIMIGDNAEEDILHYNKINDLFSNQLEINTYIRIAYSHPDEVYDLTASQIPFVTPLELAIDLKRNGFLSSKSSEWMDKLAKQISQSEKVVSDSPQFFPYWLNCSGYNPGKTSIFWPKSFDRAYSKINEICGN